MVTPPQIGSDEENPVFPYFAGTVGTMIAAGIFLGARLYAMLAAGW